VPCGRDKCVPKWRITLEQAAFNQILTRALATLPAPDGLAALGQGRDQPLADTIASALSTAPTPSIGQIHAALESGHEQNP
jgi:hypothetical protein